MAETPHSDNAAGAFGAFNCSLKRHAGPGVLYYLHCCSAAALLFIDAFAEMLKIEQYYQRGKNVVHALQALIIFLGAIVTIAIYTKGGGHDGRIDYYFLLVSAPFVLYEL